MMIICFLHILKPTNSKHSISIFQMLRIVLNLQLVSINPHKKSARTESFTETHFSYLIAFISTTATVFCYHFPYNTNFKKWYLEAERKNKKSRWL